MPDPQELERLAAELRALLAKATPTPWLQGAYDMSAILWSYETHRNGYAKQIATTGPKEDWRGASQQADDAALIVAAVNALPTLLNALSGIRHEG